MDGDSKIFGMGELEDFFFLRRGGEWGGRNIKFLVGGNDNAFT